MKRSPGRFRSKGFDMKDFKGRVAVVTGAASGIGLGAVERFLSEGMKVVMADIEKAGLDRQVSRLSDAGGEVLGVVCDVRDSDSVSDLAARTLSHFGGVHVVMNNAGVAPAGPMLDATPADWRCIVDVEGPRCRLGDCGVRTHSSRRRGREHHQYRFRSGLRE